MKKQLTPWQIGVAVLLILSACKLPGAITGGTPLPRPESLPPMPPAIIETNPTAGNQIPLRTTITFYFNQPMQRASVESALIIEPVLPGRLSWDGDSIAVFTPDAALPAATELTFTLDTTIRSKNGQVPSSPQVVTFRTAEMLEVVQILPEDTSSEVVATSAVVASFNQPVVALGAEGASLPDAFTLEPQAAGKGEWLNTSTFIFYPDPALEGGITYTARLNTDLVASSGSPMDESQDWSFTVAKPRLLSLEPSRDELLRLDADLILMFNQPMDAASVEAGFSFTGPTGRVSGQTSWDENNTTMTFTPSVLLARDADYTVNLSAQVQGRGGTPIVGATYHTLHTYPDFRVLESEPGEGGVMGAYAHPGFTMSSPVQEEDASDLITVSPAVPNVSTYTDGSDLRIHADFYPNADYTITLSPDLKDIWGQPLGEEYLLHFTTAAADPSLSFPYVGTDAYLLRADQPDFYAQAVNVSYIDLEMGTVPLDTFLYLNASGNWEERNSYQPEEMTSWRQIIQHATANVNEPVKIQLPEEGGTLTPGIYHLRADNTQVQYKPSPAFLVASYVNLTLKGGAQDALVWAVDLRSNTPVSNAAVRLYDPDGKLIGSGVTDDQGIWQTAIAFENSYEEYYAVLGQPGDDIFSLAGTNWDQDISPWDFGLSQYLQPEHTDVYMYTDRPIYRPGQTVYFRAVVRQAFDGQYSDSAISSLALTLNSGYGQTWPFDLPLSAFGTAHGEFAIPEDAQPGYYTFENDDLNFYFSFNVADYRKPEINLSVEFTPTKIQSGESLEANVNARYFFDAPSGTLPVEWVLYSANDYFYLRDYHVGTFTDRWLNPGVSYGYYDFGETVLSGKGVTGPDGNLVIDIPADNLPEVQNRTTLTLEVTAQDESGQPVSARATAELHPADFYIGIRPDVWVGQAGSAIGFDVLSVDWAGDPDGTHTLYAEFSAVTWERTDTVSSYGDKYYRFTPVYTKITSADFATGSDGRARLEFTPPNAGTYLLDISGEGAHSQTLLWVGGTAQAIWPNLPHNQIRLTADRDSYQSGQTAKIFIPNPLSADTQALVSVERGTIHSFQVLTLGPSGTVFSLPLTYSDAPNIYISATLVGSETFLQGYVNLSVENPTRILNVELTSDPQRAGPRDPVTFSLRVTDSEGEPVQGEFSLAVVDLAALALADPNSLNIVQQFTQEEPLGIVTSLSLAADPLRGIYMVGGLGGGGGADISVVREDFPDTAYWTADIVTDADGRANVSITLPDNLTTWQVDVRGLTKDTRVGQAEMQIVTTKDLLVRPVTPPFLVAGDHVEVGAVVHNNTPDKLEVKVTLQAINFTLDRNPKPTQKVTIPAGGRALISWWGTAQEAETADLTFSALAGNLSDASIPSNGPVPILHYIAPQTYSTAGILSSSGAKLEAVSLPRSFDPSGGELTVELSPSLAASILSELDSIEDPPSTASNEYLASYILPNLEVYRALQDAGLEDAALHERVQTKIQSALTRLVNHQNYNDGGWAWYTSASSQWESYQPDSDPYLSAYILFGLYHARQAGFEISEDSIEQARQFLSNELIESKNPELDLRAFITFVLQETGGTSDDYLGTLVSQKELLSPWAQALLALTLDGVSSGNPASAGLIANLETSAMRSATGAFWESEESGWRQPSTNLITTAMISYALARNDPASPLLADAVRYLSINRGAADLWGSTYETAWIILALNTYMVGTGGYAADYSYNATLNNQPLAQGQASGPSSLTPVVSSVPISSLLPDYPNALSINRGEGNGSLYYRAALQVYQPVESIQALMKGIRIERNYYPGDCDKDCQPVLSTQLKEGARLKVSLKLTIPHDAYYLMVQDAIPAGAEILNTNLKTSQQGEGSGTNFEIYDPENPYENGWGWWYFSSPQIHDDHIVWSVDYLPAGTYILTYTLIPMQAGEFRVIPAHAWLTFFPEVQGTSAGEIFEIKR